MDNIKIKKKKSLTKEIAMAVMNYMMELDPENKTWLYKSVEKSSKKLVKLYFSAIKKQYKEIEKAVGEKNEKVITGPALQSSAPGSSHYKRMHL
jgi:hypothetical protein